MPSRTTIGTNLATILSLLHGSMGIYGLLNPLGAARAFGIPVSTTTYHYVSIFASRNLVTSLGTLVLLWYGERRAVGLMAPLGLIAIATDVVTVARAQGTFWESAVGMVVFAPLPVVVGWLLLR